MNLYFATGACSLSPHIVLHELGLPFKAIRIDGKTHKTETGADYYTIEPKGQVPALQLDGRPGAHRGRGDRAVPRRPEAGGQARPRDGTRERYRLQEWLNFVATELHKGFSPLFNPKFTGRAAGGAGGARRQADRPRGGHALEEPVPHGHAFSVADAYLFTILTWTKRVELDLARGRRITAFVASMRERAVGAGGDEDRRAELSFRIRARG